MERETPGGGVARERPSDGADATDQERASEQSEQSERQAHGTENPPHTTTGPVTAPKFGSAGSGGAELEPGPERD